MTEHCDFVEQVSTATEGGLLRPDMIIQLPEKKTIIVDSKTPLDAYMKAFETDNEPQQLAFLSQHAAAVKDHLRKLSSKGYWSQFADSPDYVVLYMQIESSFAAALQSDPALIEEAIRHKIIFATPTTLITLLRTVGFIWQQRNDNKTIRRFQNRNSLECSTFGESPKRDRSYDSPAPFQNETRKDLFASRNK